jgi:hypothetical protein
MWSVLCSDIYTVSSHNVTNMISVVHLHIYSLFTQCDKCDQCWWRDCIYVGVQHWSHLSHCVERLYICYYTTLITFVTLCEETVYMSLHNTDHICHIVWRDCIYVGLHIYSISTQCDKCDQCCTPTYIQSLHTMWQMWSVLYSYIYTVSPHNVTKETVYMSLHNTDHICHIVWRDCIYVGVQHWSYLSHCVERLYM